MSVLTLEVLRPTGLETLEKQAHLARRLDTLEGKRVGLVWNNKDYGDKLLDEVEELLRKRYTTVQISRWRLFDCCTPPKQDELKKIATEVDAVIYAIGD